MTSNNPWKSVETGAFADRPIKFFNVRFGQSPDYKNDDGTLPVIMLFDMENGDGETREDQILSIGKGFVVVDGGEGVKHSVARLNKNDAAFGKGSKGAGFLDSLADIARDELLDRFEQLGAGPRSAKFWEGLVVWYEEKDVPFGKPDKDGNQRTFRQPTATRFYGWDVDVPDEDEEGSEAEGNDETPQQPQPNPPEKGGDAPVQKAAKKTPAKRAPKRPVPAITAESLGLDEGVFDELVALAKDKTDFYDFIEAAYLTDHINDDKVQEAVDKEDGGIWTAAQQ